jgi:hypothetical protein
MSQNYADSGFRGGNLWIDGGGSLSFLEMTQHKKISGYNKGKCNERDDLQTDPNGVIHAIIMHEDERTKRSAQKNIENSPDQFPFPSNSKNYHQNKGGNHMHEKCNELFAQSAMSKGIKGEYTYKCNGYNADYAWSKREEFHSKFPSLLNEFL